MSRVETVSMRDIYMQLMLSVNEDYDDDLLEDSIELLFND